MNYTPTVINITQGLNPSLDIQFKHFLLISKKAQEGKVKIKSNAFDVYQNYVSNTSLSSGEEIQKIIPIGF